MKMNTFKGKVLAVVAALLLAASAAVAAPATEQSSDQAQLAKKVRKELVTLPWDGVVGNLAFQSDGSRVERVVNNIQVLPLSSFDNDIRVRTYRALFGWNSPLFRYGRGVNPSIHIVVNGGHVTLEGVVSSEGDRRLAYIRANSVPGVFSVTNNLRNENARAR